MGPSTYSVESDSNSRYSIRTGLNCRTCSWCSRRVGELLVVGKTTTYLVTKVVSVVVE